MEQTKAIIKTIALTLIITSTYPNITAKEHPYTNSKETTFDETDKLAIQTFSNTVNSMFNIVQKPDDKQNVISNVGNIIGGIFNFVAQVVTQNKVRSLEYRQLNQELQALLEQYIKKT